MLRYAVIILAMLAACAHAPCHAVDAPPMHCAECGRKLVCGNSDCPCLGDYCERGR
jgi:hypothetical protein